MKRLPKQLRAQRGYIKRFARIPRTEQSLLLRVFSVWRQFGWGCGSCHFAFARGVPCETTSNGSPSLERLVWAWTVVSRYIPRATCPTQALAAQTLLAARVRVAA